MNTQLEFREYKIILKASEFDNKDTGKQKIMNIIKSLTTKLQLKFKESSDPGERKKVWYLDTDQFLLYDKNHFIIRIKEDQKKMAGE